MVFVNLLKVVPLWKIHNEIPAVRQSFEDSCRQPGVLLAPTEQGSLDVLLESVAEQ